MMLYRIVRFRNCHDNRPRVAEESWEHFVSKLKHEIQSEKDGPAFSPIAIADGIEGFKIDGWEYDKKDKQKKVAKVYVNEQGEKVVTSLDDKILRRNTNVRFVSMAVMDFDKGQDPQPIKERLSEYNYCIYSTHSSTKEIPKWRLVLPFKDNVAADEFRNMWPFGFDNDGMDQSCKDLARLFYLPACPEERAPEAFIFSQTGKKYFVPKKPEPKIKESKKPKEKKKPKAILMDYKTLDGVAWFTVHGSYIRAADGNGIKHHIVCPWQVEHTKGQSTETDTCLYIEPNKWPTFACSHSHCSSRGIKDVIDLWGDADSFCSKQLALKDLETQVIIRSLGFDEDGRYYYQCNSTSHIVALRASEHKELQFYSITADKTYWLKHFGDPESGQIAWKNAAAKMMGNCHKQGFFRLDKVRGGGVWDDSGRIVAHMGKHILCDGKTEELSGFKSEYTYEASVHNTDIVRPLMKEQAGKILEFACKLPITNPAEAWFLAGMVPIGLLSGILDWRPHLWITGDQASGKSSILTYFMNPLWFPISGIATSEGRTTDAGIRQKLKRSAFPVIIDESEADTQNDQQRIEAIISLARSSSSVSDGRVLKGTVSGNGMEFVVRSCFVLCSISHSLERPQDKQRFTVIKCEMTDEHAANWQELKALMKATLTREFALALYARTIDLADIIMHNAKVFQTHIMKTVKGADARFGEQLGTLLAGAFSLISDSYADEDSAAFLIEQMGDGFVREADKTESNVPINTLNIILSHVIKEGGRVQSILELITTARSLGSGGSWESSTEASHTLLRYGIYVNIKESCICVSSNHPQLKNIFHEYGVSGHHGLLSMLPKTKKGLQRFGAVVSHCVKIPLKEYLEFKDEQESLL